MEHDDRRGAKQPHRFDPKKAALLDDPARLEQLPPAELAALLDAPRGGLVADFGTGTGLYALELARLRPDLTIAALDEQDAMLALLRAKLAAKPVASVSPVLAGTPQAAALAGRVDRVLALNVLHELGDAALAELAALLKPDGRALFVDWNAAVERPVGPPRGHVFAPAQARARLEGLGWRVGPERLFRWHYALTANPLRAAGIQQAMKTNIHPVERAVRVAAGAALTALAFWGPANKWFLLGLIPLATGLLGWCPPYALLGISTCPKK